MALFVPQHSKTGCSGKMQCQLMSASPTSAPKGTSTSDTLLGTGVYDLVDTARLIRRQPETVARWTQGEDPLHAVSEAAYFSFLDVVSLHVISELRNRGVSLGNIRRGGEYLAHRLDTRHPYAHRRLATVGRAFFGRLGEWYDIGMRGQGAFETVIEEALQPIEYGANDLAVIWRPATGVWINPLVQTGSPCIEGTRVPTRVVAGMVVAGDDPAEVAVDFALDISQVEAALQYEQAA